MGDVPLLPDPGPPPPRVADRLAQAMAQLHELLSLTLTGERRGRLRRPVLFLLAAAGLVTAPVSALTVIALLAVMLLALTDNIVEVIAK